MATIVTMKVPFGTDIYDRVNEEMDTENNLPDGLVSHYAAETDGGVLIVDIWDSKDHFEQFSNERLMPAVAKVIGGPPPAGGPEPTFAELHNIAELTPRLRWAVWRRR